jgi:hypothetical protein
MGEGLAVYGRTLPRGVVLAFKSLIVVACVLFVVLPQLVSSFAASDRYAGNRDSESVATNNALESARCARETGRWLLLICEKDRIVPFSAEDPGQALLLSLWAHLADRNPTPMDVARLNIGINALGLVILVATLLIFGAFITAVVVLLLGPTVFLGWFGVFPHWALIGVGSMQLVLPLALLARSRNWLPPAVSGGLIAAGLLLLAATALLREAVGLSALVVTLCAGVWAMRHDVGQPRRVTGTLLILALAAVIASQSSRLVVVARNSAYSIDGSQLPATHGMSHTLYTGLGAVPNKFGLHATDEDGLAAASAELPGITPMSNDYFRLMWTLYLRKWQEDPQEVARIYLVKVGLLLADSVIDPGIPLALVIALAIVIQLLERHRRWSLADRRSDTRLAINLVVLGLTAMFLAQAVLATPTRFYSMPIGPYILVLAGIAIENLAAWGCRTAWLQSRL